MTMRALAPGLLRNPEAMRQLLGKDLDHARALAPEADPAMAALVHAAEALLERLGRAAGAGRRIAVPPALQSQPRYGCASSRPRSGARPQSCWNSFDSDALE
jgi:hypothetical protein